MPTTGRSSRDEASGWPEYERVCSLLEQCWCDVWRMAVSGRVPQTPGFPDLVVFSPVRGHAYIQVKHGAGRETAKQREFRALCDVHGITYILGGVAEVRDWLAPKRGEHVVRAIPEVARLLRTAKL
jgi:hypothetical protein